MSESVGRIDLDLGVNYSNFNRQVHGIAGNAQGLLGGAFKKLGFVIAGAFAVNSLVKFGSSAIKLASDLNEVQNVVDVTFGSMSGQINDFAKTALEKFGMSELSAKRFASTIGAMMKSSGIGGQQLVNMSKGVAGLSADFASFYNLNQEDAFMKIRSGLSGETEPLKQLGVNMSVANMEAYALSQGIKASYSKMDQASQTLLRYNYLLSVTKDAQGDFARTSNSWANQTRLLSEQWNIFKGTMGQGFINMLTPVLRGLNFVILKLQTAAQYFKAFTEMLFGNAGPASTSSAAISDSLGGVSDATNGVGDAAKKTSKAVKNSLAGFDQLNVLSKNTADNMGDAASSMGGLGDVTTPTGGPDISLDPKILGAMNTLSNVFENIKSLAIQTGQFLNSTFGPILQGIFNASIPTLIGWKNEFFSLFNDVAKLGVPLKTWFLGDFIPFLQLTMSEAGFILNGLLDSALKVFTGIRTAIMPILQSLVIQGLPFVTKFAGDIVLVFANLFSNVKSIFDKLWAQGIKPGLDVLSKMVVSCINILVGFWNKFGSDITMGLIKTFESIKGLFNNLWSKFLQPVWAAMLKELTWLWDKHFKGLVTEVLNFVGILVKEVLEITNKFVIPVINVLINKLGPGFTNAFKLIVGTIGNALATIADVAKGIIKTLGGIVTFISGVFTGDWKKAFTGLKTIVVGIFSTIGGVVKGVVNTLIEGINFFIRALNTLKVPKIDILGKTFGGFGVNIKEIPKLATGGLITQPTLAMMGEGGKKEAVVPLEDSGFMEAFGAVIAKAVAAAIGTKDNESAPRGTGDVILKVGVEELGRIAIAAINKVNGMAGAQQLII